MSTIQVTIDDTQFDAEVQVDQHEPTCATVTIGGTTLHVAIPHGVAGDAVAWVLVDGRSYELVLDRQLRTLRSARGLHRLDLRDRAMPSERPASTDGRVKAPIPGTVVRMLVCAGQAVETGQPLLVLEAMKMENQICAPRAGTVERLNIEIGQSVTLNAVLAEIS